MPYVAPLDDEKGGTWIGMNEAGVFLALTNKLTDVPDPDAPSRGLLARNILGSSRSTKEAKRNLDDRDLGRFNPFLMIVIDSDEGHFVARGTEFTDRDIQSTPVTFYLSNHTGFTVNPDHELVPDPLEDWRGDGSMEQSLMEFCSSHKKFMDRDSLCLHKEIAGTRSSSILSVGSGDDRFRYSYAPGHPCETDYDDVSLPQYFRRAVFDAWQTTR